MTVSTAHAPSRSSSPADYRPRSGTATAPHVVAEGISKRFARRRGWIETLRRPRTHDWFWAVRDVSFSVARGEFFGLLGANGAGKTTIFKLLSGAILADEGRAAVGGHDVEREPSAVRRILTPLLANERSLYWRISARENLRLYATLYGLRGAEATRRIEEVLTAVDLASIDDRMVGTFSSGMKQRLSIARALLSRPQVLLLDEPTRSLDPISARNFRQFLREVVAQREGCTVLLATHSAEEAFELCNRVVVLERGEVRAMGSVPELVHRVGDNRHRLWTSTPNHPALRVADDGSFTITRPAVAMEDGWFEIELQVEGGVEGTSALISRFVDRGVTVGRLERVQLSLADLIERVVAAGPSESKR